MNADQLSIPALWDAFLNTCDEPERLLANFDEPRNALTARRALACATATRCPDLIASVLSRVETLNLHGVSGARLMALGQLGQPEAIRATPLEIPNEISALALEDSCDQALARGMASRTLRDFDESHAQLNTALFLARTLKMAHREQHIMLELGQVLTIQGRPNPQLIELALNMPIQTSARRRAYGAYALAEACIAVGDYQRARNLVKPHDGKAPDLWGFVNALLDDSSEQAYEVTSGNYSHLAEAIWAIREQREVTMPPITPHSPEAEYSALLRGIAMLRAKSMWRQARRVFESMSILTPDQQVWQLAGLIHTAALDPVGDDLLGMMEAFNAALAKLRTREYVLPLLRALMPETYMLLALLPHPHPDIEDGLTEIPMLTGECVSHQFTRRKLPGKAAGSALWVESAATGEYIPLHRQSRERIKAALAALGHPQVINIGIALRVLAQARASAAANEQPAWNNALERALAWVDSDVLRSDLRRALTGKGA